MSGQKRCDDGASNVKVKKALDRRGFGMEGISEVTIKVANPDGIMYPRLSRLYGKLRQSGQLGTGTTMHKDVKYEIYE
jgi:hypothetical protein